ncbi:restriction endonuclease subunit S [Lacticaseibacillus paracasei]|uniref:restriction endonuclease subunit S n=1 Tax=Lacticaseibacillus paracasei TaxID=1597 RepID=UPI0022A9FFDC|nr:restriction endonuclease subunit S [Lacticaseibacillus paracasei]MCZ2766573.1 restriction endonuclease subunit S [Lacticaseibacillus paracasei]
MSKDVKNVPALRFKGYSDAWEKRKLGELAEFINGRAYKQDELLASGKYPVLRVGNFYTNDKWYYSNLELPEKYYAEEGDLLYTWSATFGPHIWIGPKVIYHYHIWKVALKNIFEKDFALQFFEADRVRLLNSTNGSTMIHVTKKDMESKGILLPDVYEQRTIGDLLKRVDHLIAATQRRIDDLEQVEKTLLQHLFDQSWRFNVYSDPWVKSKVANMAKENFGGGTPSTKKRSFWTGSLPWIQSSDLDKSNKYTVIPKKFISSAALKSSAAKKVPSNSIAVVTRVGVGKLAFINYDYATSQDFLSFSFLNWSAFFSVNLLTRVMEQMSNEGQGTSIKGVTKSELLAKSVLIPTSLEEQISIGNLLKSFDDLIKSTSNRLSKLELLKTSLLKNLFV